MRAIGIFFAAFCMAWVCGIVYAQTAPSGKGTSAKQPGVVVTSGSEASAPGGDNTTGKDTDNVLVSEEETQQTAANATANTTAGLKVKSVSPVKISTTGRQLKDHKLVVSGPVFSFDQD